MEGSPIGHSVLILNKQIINIKSADKPRLACRLEAVKQTYYSLV